MRVPLIISPSGQPLAEAQYPCKPPNNWVTKKKESRSDKLSLRQTEDNYQL